MDDRCCGHVIALGDCDCRVCPCFTASQDAFDLLDMPVVSPGVELPDLDALVGGAE